MSKAIKLGIVMDPISAINIKKDSSFAMLLQAQQRGYQIHYMEMADLYLLEGQARAATKLLTVQEDPAAWYQFGSEQDIALSELDVILMRKDPPFDTEYIYATYMLERAEDEGTLIVNKPQSLRDANEKLYTSWFSQHTPKTLVSRDAKRLKAFYQAEQDVILKPLDGMGGASIFRLKPGDANVSVIIETLTEHGSRYAMAQRFIPEIKEEILKIELDNLNLLYVALTRAAKELFIFGEAPGNSSENRILFDFIQNASVLQQTDALQIESHTLQFGSKNIVSSPALVMPKDDHLNVEDLLNTDWRTKVKISYTAPTIWNVPLNSSESFDLQDPRKYGNLIHEIFAKMDSVIIPTDRSGDIAFYLPFPVEVPSTVLP